MNEHLSAEQLEGYQSRRLAAKDLLLTDRHLGGCAGCRSRLRAIQGPVALPEVLEELNEPLHPGYEALTAYIDGKLDPADKDHVEAHALICASCRRELLDLQEFDRWLATAAVHAQAQPQSAEPQLSWMQRIAGFFSVPGRVRELGLAFSLVALGFVLLLPASRSRKAGAGFDREQARLVQMNSSPHPAFALGGSLLVAAGAATFLWSVRKRKP